MAVNETELISDLSQFGNIIVCGINNPKSYIIAIESVQVSVDDIVSTIESYILVDYPIKRDVTLDSGVFKSLYVKTEN